MKRRRFCGYDVPRELEEQILLKLPVKSLVRFISVCKDWNALITSHKFAKDRRQLQASKASSFFILGWARGDNDDDLEEKQVVSLLTIGDSIASTAVKEETHLPIRPRLIGEEKVEVVPMWGSHCNGIVCLVDKSRRLSNRIAFYDPALREHEFIHTRPDSEAQWITWGFGQDPKTGDYKFVRLLEHKADVYTLRTGRWREIELDMLTGRLFALPAGMYLKGRLYWKSFIKKNILVWFDLSDESFGTVDLPHPEDKWTDTMSLLVWNGSLVFFHEEFRGSFKMWVMDGEAGGWSRYYKTGYLCVRTPIAFWKEDELLMEGLDRFVMSYNFRTKELRKLPIPILAYPYSTYGSLYTETLVSVKTHALANI